MYENPYKKLREDFEFLPNGYRLSQRNFKMTQKHTTVLLLNMKQYGKLKQIKEMYQILR